MNSAAAKKIREIINPQDATTRRVYRRAKKQYNKTPKHLRSDFLLSLAVLLSPNHAED
tara:strand:+ start:469 stop:642 length:174 start_codon:yes stop_codon:yes gene_type:complete